MSSDLYADDVEAVARAYAAAWKHDIETVLGTPVPSWDEMGEQQRDAMRRCARAALIAADASRAKRGLVLVPREPTPEMLGAYITAIRNDASPPVELRYLEKGDWYKRHADKAWCRWRGMVAAFEKVRASQGGD